MKGYLVEVKVATFSSGFEDECSSREFSSEELALKFVFENSNVVKNVYIYDTDRMTIKRVILCVVGYKLSFIEEVGV